MVKEEKPETINKIKGEIKEKISPALKNFKIAIFLLYLNFQTCFYHNFAII